MPVTNEMIKDLQSQMKLTRNKIAYMTSVFGLDGDDMTISAFVRILENAQYRTQALRHFLEENT